MAGTPKQSHGADLNLNHKRMSGALSCCMWILAASCGFGTIWRLLAGSGGCWRCLRCWCCCCWCCLLHVCQQDVEDCSCNLCRCPLAGCGWRSTKVPLRVSGCAGCFPLRFKAGGRPRGQRSPDTALASLAAEALKRKGKQPAQPETRKGTRGTPDASSEGAGR